MDISVQEGKFKAIILIILFDLIPYVPVNNFSVMSEQVFLGWTSTKQGLMCLAQGHIAVPTVRLEPPPPPPPPPPSNLKSSTLPLSHSTPDWPAKG